MWFRFIDKKKILWQKHLFQYVLLFYSIDVNIITYCRKFCVILCIWYVFGLHAGEIWTKSYYSKCSKFELLNTKSSSFKPIFDKALTAIL